jgi:pimeloyl-ACP methyl ester carboxylesterase
MGTTRTALAATIGTALAAGLVVGAPSAAVAADVTTISGYEAPGTPTKYNKVRILKQGPKRARKVLVLIPGTSGGAGNFRVMARALLQRIDGWQVWSIDRRENLLEDHSLLQQYTAGTATSAQLVDYYLGWLADPEQQPRFQPPTTEQTAFARNWGLNVAVRDIRRVVKQARKGGRSVVLGGHSLGGRITAAYASWDFRGTPGAADLAGLVFIDGSGAANPPPTAAQARQRAADLAGASPFLDLLGLNLPWASGVFNAVGSTAAVKEPDAPSALQSFPLVPPALKAPVPATNLAQYGYGVDADTSPPSLALVHSTIGSLAADGNPRGWVDGELGSARRAARVFAESGPIDGTAWYHPVRLSLDASSVNNGKANPAQKVLGVKATLGRKATVPMYGFDAALGGGRVGTATRELARRAGVPRSQVMTVDRSATYAHIDPLSAAADRNAFVATLAKFLRNNISDPRARTAAMPR